MPPPTPDRAAADRAAFEAYEREYRERHAVGHTPGVDWFRHYYLAGAAHGRADYDETFARACRRYEGAEERELAVRRELERTKRELQSWKDGEQGEIAALIKQERKLRSDLATARADLEHARKARKGFQELYEASCRDVLANCERAEKAEGDMARVKAELDEARDIIRHERYDRTDQGARTWALKTHASAEEAVRGDGPHRPLSDLRPGEAGRVTPCGDGTPSGAAPSASPVPSYPRAPRPDEAEALTEAQADVLHAVARWSEINPTGFRDNSPQALQDAQSEVASLTRASSPAPSPVEAARDTLVAIATSMAKMADMYDEVRHEVVRTYASDVRRAAAVLDALGARGGG